MGAWDVGPFDNDDAADWVFELEGADTWEPVVDALQGVLDLEESDSGIESVAVAAAAVVAHALSDELELDEHSEAISEFIARSGAPDEYTIELAISALHAATTEDSELLELWEDDEDWLESVAKIESILSGA